MDFKLLPDDALLSMAVDAHPSWIVYAQRSGYDLDNIRGSSRDQGLFVDALFEIGSILVEGHARELKTGAPPRGLQLNLKGDVRMEADTIVMANVRRILLACCFY